MLVFLVKANGADCVWSEGVCSEFEVTDYFYGCLERKRFKLGGGGHCRLMLAASYLAFQYTSKC